MGWWEDEYFSGDVGDEGDGERDVEGDFEHVEEPEPVRHVLQRSAVEHLRYLPEPRLLHT